MTNKFLVSISSCFGASKSFLATTTPSINELVYVHDISLVLFRYQFTLQANLGQQPGQEMNENEQRLIIFTKFVIVKNRLHCLLFIFKPFLIPSYYPVIAIRPFHSSYDSTTPKKISYPNRLITPIFPISF